MKRTPFGLAIMALPLWLTIASLIFRLGWPTKLVIALVFGVTLARPEQGLLVVAALAPLGRPIAELIDDASFRVGEAMVVAFLAGWMLRGLSDRRGPTVPLQSAAWSFAAIVLTSLATVAWQLRAYPGEVAAALRHIVFMYYYPSDDWLGFVEAATLLEGLGLFTATVMLFRRHPALAMSLPAALVASAATAAAASFLLARGVGLPSALIRLAQNGERVSAHVPDSNAAGSYFAMTLCLALGMGLRRISAARRTAVWLAAAAVLSLGAWLSGSYTAAAAAVVVLAGAAAWMLTVRSRPRMRAVSVFAIVVIALAAGAGGAYLAGPARTVHGTGLRAQFAMTSARMILARPLLGVGIGRYYRTSALFLPPQAAWTYGFENAHNYFLQIAAELGLVGLGAFIVWVGATIVRAARALRKNGRDTRLLGATCGVLAFLVTCVSGHPLLIAEVAYPFWMALGLTSALAGSTLLNDAARGTHEPAAVMPTRPSRWPIATPVARSFATGACAAIIAGLALVTAGAQPLAPPASQAVDGFYGWERSDDGTQFRWTGQFASIFVPSDVSRASIPMRIPNAGRTIGSIGVALMTAGVTLRHTTVGDTWTIVEVALPRAAPLERFKRIDLRVERTWQPALYVAGTADLRLVGVQVGQLSLARE